MSKATIYKAGSLEARLRFLVTSSAQATFSLMKTDEVRLVFSSTERVLLHTGDYILTGETAEGGSGDGMLAANVPLTFGQGEGAAYVWPDKVRTLLGWKYQVTQPYMPAWNDAKKCWDYTVTLKAYYMAWASMVTRLPAVSSGGQYVLRDSDFSLTDQMERHAYILLLNLRLNGAEARDGLTYEARLRYNNKREVVVSVGNDGGMLTRDVPYDHAGEDIAYFDRTTNVVQYSNKDTIASLSAIASAWDCEWWVMGNRIYFGRLDNAGSSTTIEAGQQAAAISAQSSSGTYATRLYAYGGTKNIPATYRKVLVFSNSANGKEGGSSITDDSRLLSYDCFQPSMRTPGNSAGMSIPNNTQQQRLRDYVLRFGIVVNDGGYLYGGVGETKPQNCTTPLASTGTEMKTEFVSTLASSVSPARYALKGLWLMSTEQTIDIRIKWTVGGAQVYEGTVSSAGINYMSGYTKTRTGLYVARGVYVHSIATVADFACFATEEQMQISVRATNAYPVWLDMDNVVLADNNYSVTGIHVTFTGTATGAPHPLAEHTIIARLNTSKALTTSIDARQLVVLQEDNTGIDLSHINKGDTYTIAQADLLNGKVRALYWSDKDTAVALNNITEARLMLPEGTPYVDAFDGMDEADVVEAVKVFDDIYPSREDTVSDTRTYAYASDETDGVTGEVIKKAWNAYQFKAALASKDFSGDYLLQTGEPLRVTFSTGLLAGMTFDVVYNPTHAGESAKPETNADGTRNEDATWLEIVRNEDYGTGLPNDTLRPQAGDKFTLFNYDVQYVSASLLPQAESRLQEAAKAYLERLIHNDGTYTVTLKAGWLQESGKWFALGDRMRIDTSSWLDPVRDERIIGYSIHLDIPEDAPQFTLGENARYSRLDSIAKGTKG